MSSDQKYLDYDPVVRSGNKPPKEENGWTVEPSNKTPATSFSVTSHPDENDENPVKLPQSLAAKSIADQVDYPKNETLSSRQGHSLAFVGLFMFTVILYFRPYEWLPALSSFTSMAFVAAIFTLAVFTPSQLALDGNLTVRLREVKLVVLLCVCALISIVFAINISMAWGKFNESFIKAVLMFIVMINVVRNRRRLKQLFWLSMSVAFVLGWGALEDYRSGAFSVEGYRVSGRIGNLFGNPNDLALYLITVLPVVVALLLSSKKIVGKIFYLICCLVIVAGTVVTFSRGGFLGLMAVSTVLAWKIGHRNRLVISLAGIVCMSAFIAFAPGNYGTRVLSIYNSSLDAVGSSTARKDLLIRSIFVTIKNPLFGVGMGNFHSVSIHEQESHNAYTQVSSEMGLAAMVIYIMFIISPLRRLRQIERENADHKRHDKQIYYFAIGLQASLIGYMVSSFFGSVAYQWYIYYLVGYAVCLRRIYYTELEVQPKTLNSFELPNSTAFPSPSYTSKSVWHV